MLPSLPQRRCGRDTRRRSFVSSGRGPRRKTGRGVLCGTSRRRSYARHGERARPLLLLRRTRTTTATARPHTRHNRLRVGARELRRRRPTGAFFPPPGRRPLQFGLRGAAGARAVDEPPPTTQTPNLCFLIHVTFRSRHNFAVMTRGILGCLGGRW